MWLLLGLTAAPARNVAAGTDPDRPNLRVRVYAMTKVAHVKSIAAALDEAVAIFVQAGIDVRWIDCSMPEGRAGAPPEPCARPLNAGDVAIRLVNVHTSHLARTLPLGDSLLDPSRGWGSLATIYVDRVEWLARSSRIDEGVVLGRAMAHELGHLLLGSRVHGHSGLMRATWTHDELVHPRPSDWMFTSDDVTGLLKGYERRFVRAPASLLAASARP
jgi:hypothetical protein